MLWILIALSLVTLTSCLEISKTQRNISSRIVGGEPTFIENHPYQVSLIYIDIHICGASIISARYVLTAAHCTYNIPAAFLRIRAGSTLLIQRGTVITVSSVESHPQFDHTTMDFDISILKLSRNLEFSRSIQPINLPNQNDAIPGEVQGTASGWGLLSENGMIPVQLQKVSVPTLSQEICEYIFGQQVTDRMFCAGYPEGGRDACQGDSGGPYTIDNVLAGITSWGNGCGRESNPGVFTRVSYFSDYIRDAMRL